MTSPLLQTPIYSTPLVGSFSPEKSSPQTTQQALSIISGQVTRFDVRIYTDGGAPFPFVGPLEHTQIIFTLRDTHGNLVLAPRICTVFLRELGWYHIQLNEIDTSLAGGDYTWDLWAILPDGAEVPLTGIQKMTIVKGMHHFLDFSSSRPQTPLVLGTPPTAQYNFARIGLGRQTSTPTRVISVGDSISAGGVIATAALGGWQWWFQHLCNLYNKDILWVGPPGLSDASPSTNYPTQVDGLAWGICNAGFSGATIANIVSPSSLGIQPYWDGTVATYMQTYLPDLMLPMIGTNDLKSPQAGQTAAATLARFQTLMGFWQSAITTIGKTVNIIEATVIPPGKTFSITPAYPAYFNVQFAAYLPLFTSYLGTLGKSVRVADIYSRFDRFVGKFGEDYCGSIDFDKTEMATPTDTYTLPTGQQFGYTAVGASTAGAITAGCLTDGLHPNFNNGMRIMAEVYFAACYDLLANKI